MITPLKSSQKDERSNKVIAIKELRKIQIDDKNSQNTTEQYFYL